MSAAPRMEMEDRPRTRNSGEVLLGEDWVSPDATVETLYGIGYRYNEE